MSRERMVHPGIWINRDFCSVSRDARLLYIALISHADDHGRLSAEPFGLKLQAFPADDMQPEEVEELLENLSTAGLIQLYEAVDGKYIQLPKWEKWQKLRYKSKSRFPGPEQACDNPDKSVRICPDLSGLAPKRREEKRSKAASPDAPEGACGGRSPCEATSKDKAGLDTYQANNDQSQRPIEARLLDELTEPWGTRAKTIYQKVLLYVTTLSQDARVFWLAHVHSVGTRKLKHPWPAVDGIIKRINDGRSLDPPDASMQWAKEALERMERE